MSYWDILPLDLQTYIYEFDTTYKDVRNKLIKELLYRTPYWRTRYLNKHATNHNRFENKRKEVMFICNCWNQTYEGINSSLYFNPTEEEFITDNSANKYSIIFRDLNMLKTYNFIFNNNEIRLIRKKYRTPDKLAKKIINK